MASSEKMAASETTTETITCTVNGEARALPAGAALPHVLRQMDVDPENARGVAVAVNDTVVRRADWPKAHLSDGDRVEVITARQGG